VHPARAWRVHRADEGPITQNDTDFVRYFALLLILTLFQGGCRNADADATMGMVWQPVDALNSELPEEIRVFAAEDPEAPLRAWYTRIDRAMVDRIRVLVADNVENRQTALEFADHAQACVVVNAGYFTMDRSPAGHVGLLMKDGAILEPATRTVNRDDVEYETARASVAFTDSGLDIAWATTRSDTLWRWPVPPAHREGRPALPLEYVNARPWLSATSAIGAGPALVVNGRIRVTDEAEVFFGTSIPQVHPRTAIGTTRNGDVILMVVDGRQDASRGVDLKELATLMREVGSYQAMNLDGGGSSTIVINGRVLNMPAGDTLLRPVMSAIGVNCN
jgi:hypothetical protein